MRRRWLVAWLGAAAIGVANGIVREATYGRRLDERTANPLSGVTAIAALTAYAAALQRRWPIATDREAIRIGGAWLVLTVAFEFGFGRLVAKDSWEELIRAYDLTEGNLWPLVVAWIAIAPAATRRTLGPTAPSI